MKIKITIVMLLFMVFSCMASLDDAQCIKAIAGEASGEPYAAKVAVAAVIRNRGSLRGVYGVHARHHESAHVISICRKAWLESATYDPTHGCDMFGGIIDDKYFKSLGLKPVLTIGHTRFYHSNLR